MLKHETFARVWVALPEIYNEMTRYSNSSTFFMIEFLHETVVYKSYIVSFLFLLIIIRVIRKESKIFNNNQKSKIENKYQATLLLRFEYQVKSFLHNYRIISWMKND